mgnify:CR=1 FL=1
MNSIMVERKNNDDFVNLCRLRGEKRCTVLETLVLK